MFMLVYASLLNPGSIHNQDSRNVPSVYRSQIPINNQDRFYAYRYTGRMGKGD